MVLVAPLLEKAKRSKLLIFSEYREFFIFTRYAKNSKFQPTSVEQKVEQIRRYFISTFCLCLTLFVSMLHSETLSTFP